MTSQDIAAMADPRPDLYFVWNYRNWGGAQIYVLGLIKTAVKDWNVTAIFPDGSGGGLQNILETAGAKCELLNGHLVEKTPSSVSEKIERQRVRIRSEFEVYRHLKAKGLRNAVVHIDVAPWQSWILLWAIARQGARVFVTIHNAIANVSLPRRIIWKTRLLILSKVMQLHLFTANRHTKDSLRPYFNEKDWEKIVVTPVGVDRHLIEKASANDFDREKTLQRLEIPANKKLVLTVGQFVDRKGRWILLETIDRLIPKRKDLVFVWVMPRLPNDAEMQKIKSYRHYENFYPVLSEAVATGREGVLTFFRAADVFVLPSYLEGLPIAILEAMALGIPTISTSINAIPEAIINRETGALVPPGDSEAIAEAITNIIDDSSLAAKLGKNARKFVLENFDEQTSAENASYCFEKALADVRPKGK